MTDATIEARYSEAIRLRDAGDYRGALAEFESILSTEPDDDWPAAILVGKMSCYLRIPDLKAARALADLANTERMGIKRETRLYLDYMLSCLAQLEMNSQDCVDRFERLRGDYSDLLKIADHEWLQAEIEEREGVALGMLNRPDEAISHLERALQKAPKDAGTIHFSLALARTALGDFSGAIRECRSALRSTDPIVVAKSHYQLGVLQYQTGDYQSALDNLEKATSGPLSHLGLASEAIERDLRRARAKVQT